MTPPTLLATHFGDGEHGDMYTRLARVLTHTARAHCFGWDIRVERIEPPSYRSAMGNRSHVWNTQKLAWWRDRVFEAQDGARLLLIDGDTAILRSLDPVWSLDFDIAYTVRERGLPLNGGVVFLRVSDRTREFVRSWWEHNVRFLGDAALHQPWARKYAGINQSALGCVLETVAHGCHLVQLGCREWNACSPELYSPGVTRILHIKSRLRRATFGTEPAAPNMADPIRLWHGLEASARKEE